MNCCLNFTPSTSNFFVFYLCGSVSGSIFEKYKSGSIKLLNADQNWIRIHNTGAGCLVPSLILSGTLFVTNKPWWFLKLFETNVGCREQKKTKAADCLKPKNCKCTNVLSPFILKRWMGCHMSGTVMVILSLNSSDGAKREYREREKKNFWIFFSVLFIVLACTWSVVDFLFFWRSRDQTLTTDDISGSSCRVVGGVPCPYHSQQNLVQACRLTRALTGSRQCLAGEPVSLQRVALLPGNTNTLLTSSHIFCSCQYTTGEWQNHGSYVVHGGFYRPLWILILKLANCSLRTTGHLLLKVLYSSFLSLIINIKYVNYHKKEKETDGLIYLPTLFLCYTITNLASLRWPPKLLFYLLNFLNKKKLTTIYSST